MSYFL